MIPWYVSVTTVVVIMVILSMIYNSRAHCGAAYTSLLPTGQSSSMTSLWCHKLDCRRPVRGEWNSSMTERLRDVSPLVPNARRNKASHSVHFEFWWNDCDFLIQVVRGDRVPSLTEFIRSCVGRTHRFFRNARTQERTTRNFKAFLRSERYGTIGRNSEIYLYFNVWNSDVLLPSIVLYFCFAE